MGFHKALLKIGKKTFLQQIVEILSNQNIKHNYIVLGAQAEEIRPSIEGLPVNVIINEHWQEGQLSSLIAGLDVLDENKSDGVLVWPVDHPLVPGSVVRKLIEAFDRELDKIIIPTYGGKRGHPVIFPRQLFKDIRSAPIERGARVVVHHHADRITEIETDEEAVTINIDTPADYKKYVTINNQ